MLTGSEGKKQCINYFIGIYICLVSKNDYSPKANRNFLLSMHFFSQKYEQNYGDLFFENIVKKPFFMQSAF